MEFKKEIYLMMLLRRKLVKKIILHQLKRFKIIILMFEIFKDIINYSFQEFKINNFILISYISKYLNIIYF
jgi:hypothetical protein